MKNITAAVIFGLCALPALADGFYVAGDIGRDRWTSDTTDNTKTSNVVSIAAGYEFGLPFQDSVALELGYRDLGNINESDATTNIKTDLTATEISMIARHFFSDQISLYGRLGYAEVQLDWKLQNAQANADGSVSKDKLFGGVGGRYAFTEKLGLRIEYDRYDKVNDIVISSLTAGVDYHF